MKIKNIVLSLLVILGGVGAFCSSPVLANDTTTSQPSMASQNLPTSMEESLLYYKNFNPTSNEDVYRWQMQMYKETLNMRWDIPLDTGSKWE